MTKDLKKTKNQKKNEDDVIKMSQRDLEVNELSYSAGPRHDH
jgi:hypothetical protein